MESKGTVHKGEATDFWEQLETCMQTEDILYTYSWSFTYGLLIFTKRRPEEMMEKAEEHGWLEEHGRC